MIVAETLPPGTKGNRENRLLVCRMGPQSYPAANMCYPSRAGKNNSASDSQILRLPLPPQAQTTTGPGGKAASTF